MYESKRLVLDVLFHDSYISYIKIYNILPAATIVFRKGMNKQVMSIHCHSSSRRKIPFTMVVFHVLLMCY